MTPRKGGYFFKVLAKSKKSTKIASDQVKLQTTFVLAQKP
jgi:hypothetical protein